MYFCQKKMPETVSAHAEVVDLAASARRLLSPIPKPASHEDTRREFEKQPAVR
jgi:hypothetical protein